MNDLKAAREIVQVAGLLSEMRVLRRMGRGDWEKHVFQLPVVKRGTVQALNAWAKAQGFEFIRDTSLFKGHWADPENGDSYLFDTM